MGYPRGKGSEMKNVLVYPSNRSRVRHEQKKKEGMRED
jgi:hypothetical protein